MDSLVMLYRANSDAVFLADSKADVAADLKTEAIIDTEPGANITGIAIEGPDWESIKRKIKKKL